ncbi:MAG: PorT family protein [candidate division WOR-3 bacterium]|nr:MAG: PorT family protein [candidate division WOR-3 bacterium]
MNSRVTAPLVVLLFAALALAPAQKITGGLKAGMNLATVSGFEDELGEDVGYRMGFCGGGFAAFALGDIVVIQPEFLFSQKGLKAEETVLDETWTLTYKFSYLEIPLSFKMVLPIQGKVKPNFFVGPYFAMMITTPRGKIEVDGVSMEADLNDVAEIDFGVVFGGGVDFGLGKGKIVLDFRYGLGLTTLDETGTEDVKNGAFSFLIGYSF